MAALHALDTMMGHLTDILAIPKFDKLNPALWEMFFGAARVLVGLVNGDSILVFNKIIKVKDMMCYAYAKNIIFCCLIDTGFTEILNFLVLYRYSIAF